MFAKKNKQTNKQLLFAYVFDYIVLIYSNNTSSWATMK